MNTNSNWKPNKKWYQYSGLTSTDAHARRYKGHIDRSKNLLSYLFPVFTLVFVVVVFASYFSNN